LLTVVGGLIAVWLVVVWYVLPLVHRRSRVLD